MPDHFCLNARTAKENVNVIPICSKGRSCGQSYKYSVVEKRTRTFLSISSNVQKLEQKLSILDSIKLKHIFLI